MRDGEELARLLAGAPQGINRDLRWEELLPAPSRDVGEEASLELESPSFRRDLVAASAVVRVPQLEVPQQVRRGSTFDVSFHLDTDLPEGTDQWAPAVLDAPSSRFGVGVWLAATQPFEIAGSPIQSLVVDRFRARTESVQFAVSATGRLAPDAKAASLTAVVTQLGRARGFIKRGFEVLRERDGWILESDRGSDDFDTFRSVVGQPEPDLTVFVRAADSELRDFRCVVQTPHLDGYRDGREGSWQLPDRSRSIVERFMEDFTEGRTAVARRTALTGAGYELFRASPPVFQEAFWALIDGGVSIATIFVVSEEPYIPWELMIPNRVALGMQERRDPLGVEFGLGRWTARPWGAPPLEIRIKRSLVVAPNDPCVPNGAAEAAYVASLSNGTELLPASTEAFDDTLADSAFDLLHFACHGVTDHGTATQQLYLEGHETLSPYFLQALPGVCAGLERTQPLVFLNACEVGRQTASLVDTGGFPVSFLQLQAGSVVAPLWSVADETAFTVAQDFYDTVLGDRTARVGEVMARLRRRAYEAAEFDDTFAAYAFYGDPLARIVIGP